MDPQSDSSTNYNLPVVVVEKRSNRQKYDGTQPLRVMEMAAKGMWPEEWLVEFGIVRSTLYEWCNTHPEFEEAVENAWEILHAWAAKKWRENLSNPNFKNSMFMEKLRRRMPSTFGLTPDLTSEGFKHRNDPPPPAPGTEPAAAIGDTRSAELDDIEKQIEALKIRRAHEGEKT